MPETKRPEAGSPPPSSGPCRAAHPGTSRPGPSPRLRPREHTACSGGWTWGWRAVLGGDQPGPGGAAGGLQARLGPGSAGSSPHHRSPKLNFFETPEVGGRATPPRPQGRLVTQRAAANRAPPAFALLRGRPMGAGLAAASCSQARRPRGSAGSLARPQRRNRRDSARRAPAQVSAAAARRWDGRPRPSGQVGAAEAAAAFAPRAARWEGAVPVLFPAHPAGRRPRTPTPTPERDTPTSLCAGVTWEVIGGCRGSSCEEPVCPSSGQW